MSYANGLLYNFQSQGLAYNTYNSLSSFDSNADPAGGGPNPASGNGSTGYITVYNTGATTDYYASFLNPSTQQQPSGVLNVSSFTMMSSVSSAYYLNYYCAKFQLSLNSVTNPSSSVYNIFLNLFLLNQPPTTDVSGSTGDVYPYPFLPVFASTSTTLTTPACDVLLTLCSQGQKISTPIYSLLVNQISLADYTSSSTPTTYYTAGTSPGVGNTLFILNLPLSSIFPSINTPGITYDCTVEVFPYQIDVSGNSV